MSAWTRFRQFAPLLSISLFVIPVSPNYSLRELDYGQAAGGVGQSATYKIEGSVGDLNSAQMNGSTYDGGLGFGFTQMANVPPAPTFTNPASYYNKLHAVIQTANNPSDTKYALAISTDNFTTTNYVKNDQTVTASLSFADYQTYSAWGGGSGFDIIGLLPNTTYYLKVKAYSGDFTESGFGPVASAATVDPAFSFDIDVSASDTETGSPYATNMGTLTVGTVTTGSEKVWVDIDTNGANGGSVYVAGANGGLYSTRTSTLIAAVTGDLAALGSGFGLQGASATQSSGGPLSLVSPFNGAAENVGTESSIFQVIMSASAPITAGRGSFLLKAKPASTTPSSDDYQETLTIIGSASF